MNSAMLGPPRLTISRLHRPGRCRVGLRARAIIGPADHPGGEVVTEILNISKNGEYDSLLEHLPDALIDQALQLKKEYDTSSTTGAVDLDLMDCLRYGRVLENTDQSPIRLDPHALRAVVFQGPRTFKTLSSFQPSPDRYQRRVSLETYTGERMVLTFQLTLEEGLQARYKGIAMQKRWVMRSVSGEQTVAPGEPLLPQRPDKMFGPESVVQAQLAGLQTADFERVFSLASPANRAQTGPLDKFTQMITFSPVFRSLVGHKGFEVVQSLQPTAEQFLQVVRITYQPLAPPATGGGRGSRASRSQPPPPPPQKTAFLWSLSLQHDPPELEGCWCTNSVQPLGSL